MDSLSGRWLTDCGSGRLPPLLWPLIAAAIFIEQLADLPADAAVTWPLVAAVCWTAWAVALRHVAARAARACSPRWRAAPLVAIAMAEMPLA